MAVVADHADDQAAVFRVGRPLLGPRVVEQGVLDVHHLDDDVELLSQRVDLGVAGALGFPLLAQLVEGPAARVGHETFALHDLRPDSRHEAVFVFPFVHREPARGHRGADKRNELAGDVRGRGHVGGSDPANDGSEFAHRHDLAGLFREVEVAPVFRNGHVPKVAHFVVFEVFVVARRDGLDVDIEGGREAWQQNCCGELSLRLVVTEPADDRVGARVDNLRRLSHLVRAYVNAEKFNCEKLNLRLGARPGRLAACRFATCGQPAVDRSGWMLVRRSGWRAHVVAKRYAAAAMAPELSQHFIPNGRVFDALDRRQGGIVGAAL